MTDASPLDRPLDPALVHGALELERTDHGLLPHRLPAWARAQCDDPQLHLAESQPAGVRLVLRTEATRLELDVLATKRRFVGQPPLPDGHYDVVVDGEVGPSLSATTGNVLEVDVSTGLGTLTPGSPSTLAVDLPGRTATVEIWLPHNERTELVALRADAPVEPVVTGRRVWLHHGSSISHGSNADHPTGTWPAVAARLAGVDLMSLGFGGSALLDPFVARTMRDTPADLISLKIGINLVNRDHLRRRALGPAVHGFLDTIRDGHPSTPLLLLSPVYGDTHEDRPGPTMPDLTALDQGRVTYVASGDPAQVALGALTLEVVREVLAEVVAQRDDPHLRLLDGRELYGPADAVAHPLPDRLHPDAATHRLMGERFADLAGWW